MNTPLSTVLDSIPVEIARITRHRRSHVPMLGGPGYENRVILECQGRTQVFDYYQGSGNKDYPRRDEVISALLFDASLVTDYQTYEQFQDSLDYEDFPMKLVTFNLIKNNDKKLDRLFSQEHRMNINDAWEKGEE